MSRGLVVAILLTGVSWAVGQDKSTYYTVMHSDEFQIDWTAFYDKADQLTASVRQEYPHHLDLAFGDHPKQRLDLYLPKETPEDAPVFLFLHGGGFREGDRAHYGFIARPFADHGIIAAIASYRLTPEHGYPDQPEDVRSAIAWLHDNVGSYGGDPKRIYVAGHSAGAILTAGVCLNTRWLDARSLPDDVLQGCVPVSGSYDLANVGGIPAYLQDPTLADEASPLRSMAPPFPPILVAVGTEERHLGPSKRLAQRIEEEGGTVELLVLEDMAHDDTALALGDGESPLVEAILNMIRPTTR